jgi:hypothetical protein
VKNKILLCLIALSSMSVQIDSLSSNNSKRISLASALKISIAFIGVCFGLKYRNCLYSYCSKMLFKEASDLDNGDLLANECVNSSDSSVESIGFGQQQRKGIKDYIKHSWFGQQCKKVKDYVKYSAPIQSIVNARPFSYAKTKVESNSSKVNESGDFYDGAKLG